MVSCTLCARCNATVRSSGIEPLTLVPACLALDHKTREDTMIFSFWDFKDYNDYSD